MMTVRPHPDYWTCPDWSPRLHPDWTAAEADSAVGWGYPEPLQSTVVIVVIVIVVAVAVAVIVVEVIVVLVVVVPFLHAKAGTAVAHLSHRNSACLSVCHTSGSVKTVQARITKSSPYNCLEDSSFRICKLFQKFESGHPEQECQMRER